MRTRSFMLILSAEKYELKDITSAWIHVTFKDFVENGGRDEASTENKIVVTVVSTF